MQDDRISIELRLPGVKVLDVREERYWIEILAQYRTEDAECPRCGRLTWQAPGLRHSALPFFSSLLARA